MNAIATVPVIGQPTLYAVSPVVLAKCPCQSGTMLLFSGLNAVVTCAPCQRTWVLQAASSGPDGASATLAPLMTKGGN